MNCGLPDTYAYYDEAALIEGFKKCCAYQPRVIKQNRGSAGEGIWLCWIANDAKDGIIGAHEYPSKTFGEKSLGDDVVQSALGEVGFLPLLVLAAKICPPGIEGALFAALMSIFNLGGIVSTEAGALLTDAFHVSETDFSNLSPLIVTCAASSLLPLFFLGWVRGAEDSGDDDVTA